MRKHWRYLQYVVRHKWFVFLECCKMGIPLHGITHDLSKFRPDEWFPYVNYFYGNGHSGPASRRDKIGYYKPYNTGDERFDFAWLLHQKRNAHHWQWWVLPLDDGGVKAMPMKIQYVKEMVADWRGAGKAQGKPDTVAWYNAHKGDMTLASSTRALVEEYLGVKPCS